MSTGTEHIPNSAERWTPAGGLLVCLLGFATTAYALEPTYKCRDSHGKVAYTSDPTRFQSCTEITIEVPEPNPEDVARALEEKQRRRDEDRIEDEKLREERLFRAREREIDAAVRRARAAEAELNLLKRRQQQSEIPYGPTVLPFWNGRTVPDPRYAPYLGNGEWQWPNGVSPDRDRSRQPPDASEERERPEFSGGTALPR